MRPATLMTDDELASEWLACERTVNDPVDEEEQGFAVLRQLEIEREQDRRESDREVHDSA
jgi:hypothetical protein